MKTSIHPKYHTQAQVSCTCGHTFTTGSILPEIHVDICSHCHPFFTGEMKFVDTQGRVEKFEALRQKASKLQSRLKTKKKASDSDLDPDQSPKTLKEMMTQIAKQSPDTDIKPPTSPKPSKSTSKK